MNRSRIPLAIDLPPPCVITLRRKTALLIAACLFAGGFFIGAIAFGEALLRLHS